MCPHSWILLAASLLGTKAATSYHMFSSWASDSFGSAPSRTQTAQNTKWRHVDEGALTKKRGSLIDAVADAVNEAICGDVGLESSAEQFLRTGGSPLREKCMEGRKPIFDDCKDAESDGGRSAALDAAARKGSQAHVAKFADFGDKPHKDCEGIDRDAKITRLGLNLMHSKEERRRQVARNKSSKAPREGWRASEASPLPVHRTLKQASYKRGSPRDAVAAHKPESRSEKPADGTAKPGHSLIHYYAQRTGGATGRLHEFYERRASVKATVDERRGPEQPVERHSKTEIVANPGSSKKPSLPVRKRRPGMESVDPGLKRHLREANYRRYGDGGYNAPMGVDMVEMPDCATPKLVYADVGRKTDPETERERRAEEEENEAINKYLDELDECFPPTLRRRASQKGGRRG